MLLHVLFLSSLYEAKCTMLREADANNVIVLIRGSCVAIV